MIRVDEAGGCCVRCRTQFPRVALTLGPSIVDRYRRDLLASWGAGEPEAAFNFIKGAGAGDTLAAGGFAAIVSGLEMMRAPDEVATWAADRLAEVDPAESERTLATMGRSRTSAELVAAMMGELGDERSRGVYAGAVVQSGTFEVRRGEPAAKAALDGLSGDGSRRAALLEAAERNRGRGGPGCRAAGVFRQAGGAHRS